MVRVHTFAIALLCCALPSIGSAAELLVRTLGAMSFDTFNGDNGERASFILSVPIELRETGRNRYQGRLRYTPTFEGRVTGRKATNWNHILQADGSYQLSRRSYMGVFVDFASLGFLDNRTAELPDGTVDTGRRLLNTAGLQYGYALSSRWRFDASVTYFLAEFDSLARNDSQTIGGSVEMSYVLGKRDDVSLGVESSFSTFDASLRSQGQDATNLRFFVRWVHQFSEHLTFRTNLGPTVSLFETLPFPNVNVFRYPLNGDRVTGSFIKASSCPPTVPFRVNCSPGTDAPVDANTFLPLTDAQARIEVASVPVPSIEVSDTQVNFFGTFSLDYELRRWRLGVDFRRTQSTQSGFGASTVLNAFGAGATWTGERWDVRLTGRISQRKSLTSSARPTGDFSIDSATAVDTDGDAIGQIQQLATAIVSRPVNRKEAFARINVSRRITDRLRLTGSALYAYTDRRVDVRQNKGGRFRVDLGVLYSFRSVRF